MAKISHEEVKKLERFIARIKEASNSKDFTSATSQVSFYRHTNCIVVLCCVVDDRTLGRIHVPSVVLIHFQSSLYHANISLAGL